MKWAVMLGKILGNMEKIENMYPLPKSKTSSPQLRIEAQLCSSSDPHLACPSLTTIQGPSTSLQFQRSRPPTPKPRVRKRIYERIPEQTSKTSLWWARRTYECIWMLRERWCCLIQWLPLDGDVGRCVWAVRWWWDGWEWGVWWQGLSRAGRRWGG